MQCGESVAASCYAVIVSPPPKVPAQRQDGVQDRCPDQNLNPERKPHRGCRRRAMKDLEMKKIVGWPERDALILDHASARETQAGQQDGDRAQTRGQKPGPSSDV